VPVRRIAVAPQVLEFASDDPVAEGALAALYHAAPLSTAVPTLRYGLRRASGGTGYVATSPDRPPFGPASLGDAWAYLEWRATEDVLNAPADGGVFLHAGGVEIGSRLALIVGDSGAGKSTLVAHLMQRGHRMLGDDLVRFATADARFSAVGRSLKLDPNSLSSMPLIARTCSSATVGTLLAAGCWYVSPAAIRREWEAAPARPWAVVLLDAARRNGPSTVERTSAGEAAVFVTQKVLGAAAGGGQTRQEDVTVRLLDGLANVAAYRASGGDPAAVAAALEREVAA